MKNKIKDILITLTNNNPYILTFKVNKKTIIYDYSCIDSTRLERDIIPYLEKENYKNYLPSLTKISELEIEKNIFQGSLIIYDEKEKNIYSLNINGIALRSVDESSLDITLTGAKDALIENIDTNIGLIQKRLKTKDLIIKNYTMGEITKTKVSILYLDSKVNKYSLNYLIDKIENAKLESLSNIGEFQGIIDNKKSLIPLLNYTSRPDFISMSLLKSKIAILIDGIPISLIGPSTFAFFFKFHDSLSENYFVSLIDKFLFTTFFIIAILLTPLTLAITNYYPELLPFDFIATTINSRKGIFLSFTSEVIIGEILLSLFKVAGTRLAKGLNSSLLVVGSFLIGTVIINAGILSQESLFIVSLSIIASFVVSNNISFNTSVTLIRGFLILSTIIFGFIGLSVGLLIVLIYLASKSTLNIPYLYPIAPLNITHLKNTLIPSNFLKKYNIRRKTR